MNNIIDVAKNLKEIMTFEHKTNCPKCNEKQFSPFDKVYTESYGSCVDCSNEEELEEKSKNIFNLLEQSK